MASKYQSIMDFINDEIKLGNLLPNKKIPSIRELSNKFNCSNSTVIHAYSELEKNNIIFSKPQSGYYVSNNFKNYNNYNNQKSSIINLNSGLPPETLLPYEDFQFCSNKAASLYGYEIFNYTPSYGFSPLIETLQGTLKTNDINTDLKNIYICSGTQQALNILSNMPFPNNKNTILVEQPTYNLMVELLQISNCRFYSIKRDFSGINLHELEKTFQEKDIKFFYTMPRFHNPLGTSYTYEEKKEILRLANKYDVYIVEDDYLSDLELNNNSQTLYTMDTNEKVIYLKSFSKTYLPGIRVGVSIIPDALLTQFKHYKVCSDLNSCSPTQAALNIAINNGMYDKHVNEIKRIYFEKMSFFKKYIKELDTQNIEYFIPETGFFIFVKLPDRVKASQLINNLRTKNILIRNGNQSFLPKFKDESHIRICVSKANEKQLKYALPEIINEINVLNSTNQYNKIDFI